MKFSSLLALALTYTTLASAQSFRLENARKAEQLQESFKNLNSDSPCNTGDQACVDDQFAQCVGGKFALNSCGGGELKCVALPLVNSPGTSITCSTEADRLARLADARNAGKSKGKSNEIDPPKGKNKEQDLKNPGNQKDPMNPGNQNPDNEKDPKDPENQNPDNEKKPQNPEDEKKPPKNPEDEKEPKNPEDEKEPPKNPEDEKEPPKNPEDEKEPKNPEDVKEPPKNPEDVKEPPKNPEDEKKPKNPEDVKEPPKNPDNKKKPKNSEDEKKPKNPEDVKEPPKNPNDQPTGNIAETRRQNAEDAEKLQQDFNKLTPDSPCNNGDQACVDDQFAQCVGGKFALNSCGSGLKCAALPLVNKRGTSIACTTEADRVARIDDAKNSK